VHGLPDTIAAIATAPGEAGVGIVRLSGPDVLGLARGVFPSLPAAPEPRHAYLGAVVHPGGVEVDQALCTWFPAPASYTGEDVVELSCHGSNRVLAAVLSDLIALGGRLAEPGEFTRRAFLNGKMDLAAAEAVMDLIRARTDSAARVAAGQLGGRLSRRLREVRADLIALLAEIEAGIDFPEEIGCPLNADVRDRAAAARAAVVELLATAAAGRLYREGAALILAGRPNVGKSSLLNALLGEERALVTPIPGTTRDYLEESLDLDGLPVRAVDTAGLRVAADPIEAMGVDRTRSLLETADLILWVVDASAPLAPGEHPAAVSHDGRNLLAVLNKADLPRRLSPADLRPFAAVAVSARTGEGLPELRAAIRRTLLAEGLSPESVWVANARHQEQLRAAEGALLRAEKAAEAGFDQAAIALDLGLAARALGEVTGDSVTEETISEIFARFCVGK
jgi:tRNA modification GTPase